MNAEMLRVGVLVDGPTVPAWAHHLLGEIEHSDYAQVALVITDANDATPEAPPPYPSWQAPVQKIANTLANALYEKFVTYDNRKMDAFEMLPLGGVLGEPSSSGDAWGAVPNLAVDTIKTIHTDSLAENDIETIKSYQLDVLIRVGFRILKGDILQAAKHGVWSILSCDNRTLRGSPACFYETLETHPHIGCGLQVLTEELDAGKVIYNSFSETDPFSIGNNRRTMFWKSQAFFTRMLERLYTEGDSMYHSLRLINARDEYAPLPPIRKTPAPTNYLKWVVKKSFEKVRWVLHNKTKLRQWNLMFRHGDDPFVDPQEYTLIPTPKDRLWADPFVIARNNKHYVYIEEMEYEQYRGRISVFEIEADGSYTVPQPAIKEDFHLSYPFLIEHDGELWMMPESNTDRSLRLYRCTRFPDQWEWVMNLMEGKKYVDATLHFQDDLWWLYVNMGAHQTLSKRDEVNLYYAKDFRTSDWTPHPYNPIVSDVHSARPAGNLIKHNGRLLRPSQNNSRYYGYAYNLNEVLTLSTTDYKETVVKQILPDWDKSIIGTHTHSSAPGISIIDVLMVRPRKG